MESQVRRHDALGNEKAVPPARFAYKQLEEENLRLRKLVSDLSLGSGDAAGGHPKKALKPAQRRGLVDFLKGAYRDSARRACGVLKASRSSYRYKARRPEQTLLRLRIRDIAHSRVRYGYRRIHTLLCREGWQVNVKRVYRLYKLEGLQMRRKVSAQAQGECKAAGWPCLCHRRQRALVDGLCVGRTVRRAQAAGVDGRGHLYPPLPGDWGGLPVQSN